MDFTFGIPCGNISAEQVNNIVDSIEKQNIPNYEIIMVTGKIVDLPERKNLRYEEFDMHLNGKPWITKKKNIITQEAQYENIVYMHDYYLLHSNWYAGWTKFGNEFEVATNNIIMAETGARHSDWLIDPFVLWKLFPGLDWSYWNVAIPYEYTGLTSIQYISGGYWVAKKEFMQQYPLNETLAWGDAEDIEWSRRVRTQTKFKMNTGSTVWVDKPGKWTPQPISEYYLTALLREYNLRTLDEY